MVYTTKRIEGRWKCPEDEDGGDSVVLVREEKKEEKSDTLYF